MSFPTVSAPVLSPSLNEYDLPTFVDDQGNVLSLMVAVQPDANGVTSLNPAHVVAEPVSQVTAKRQMVQVGANKVPAFALMSVNLSTGALVPFTAALATLAASATSAVSATTAGTAAVVSGKFESAVRVATGSAENIAHGLGSTPSLVLVSVYDNTDAGVLASGFQVVEGAHDATNLVVTVTANAKYKVIAFK